MPHGNNHKRHGKHHRQTRRYVKVYAPYLPLIVAMVLNLVLSIWQPPSGNTLAYATEMSAGGLLQATNGQRSSNDKTTLSLNQQLSAAAQAKANDMIARNYWSHTTPDGQQPWVFIDSAGYKYLKAGENLAYGFASSNETVIGWMNSPSHQANMLDSAFSDVGFGFANGPNYNGAGEETVVVAMYGKPQTLGANTQPSPATPAPAPAPVAPAPPAPAPAPSPATPAPTPLPSSAPVQTDTLVVPAGPREISREISQVQTLTRGQAPWAFAALSTILAGLACFWLIHHSLRLRHLLRSSERLILHHPLLDATLLAYTILGLLLSRTVGVIL